jgi:hypothetical protein
MRTEDFVKLLRLQLAEAPNVRPPLGTAIIDPVSFETYETPVSDSVRVAAAIVAAANLARSGGPPAAKMSDAAERILAAGRKRRAEG